MKVLIIGTNIKQWSMNKLKNVMEFKILKLKRLWEYQAKLITLGQ